MRYAHDGAQLRRELLRRVKARMDDRAQAGMEADPVRLPGSRSNPGLMQCSTLTASTLPSTGAAVNARLPGTLLPQVLCCWGWACGGP